MTGVRRGGKGERRAREAREDRTREDRGVPSPSRAHFDFPPSLSTACLAGYLQYHLKYALCLILSHGKESHMLECQLHSGTSKPKQLVKVHLDLPLFCFPMVQLAPQHV